MNQDRLNETAISMPKALIIDDEESICDSLAGVLSDEGWTTASAQSGPDGLMKFRNQAPDIVLLDVWMPGMDGIETLQRLREIRTDIPVVVMSGHGTIETAVKATKLGAFDFLEKPLSLEKLLPMIDHARELRGGKEAVNKIASAGGCELIGTSAETELIRRQIALVAPRNSWVLITGENGTGKEIVARNIHLQSARSSRPYIAVNCAAIPEELIESELFGHKKGAFTNAIANKRGKFELAHQGTLFLDEIGDMSLRTQAKILRILQEQKFERLGGDETISVDVRVIAATNKDLLVEMEAGRFREDLFYRLNVIPFHLKPLRERLTDIKVLVDYFLDRMSLELRESRKTYSTRVLEIFQKYPWPGNVRELKNTVERLCIMAPGGEILETDLPEAMRSQMPTTLMDENNLAAAVLVSSSLKEARNEFEKSFILEKLEEYQWNVSKTAEAIGIERSNLHRKLRAYQIDPKRLKEV